MTFTLAGLLLLSMAPTFGLVLAAVACVGIGSSIFHPESSRVARTAPADVTASPNPSSRSAAMPDRPWAR